MSYFAFQIKRLPTEQDYSENMRIKLSRALHENYLCQDRLGASFNDFSQILHFTRGQRLDQGLSLLIKSDLFHELDEKTIALLIEESFEQVILIGATPRKHENAFNIIHFEDEYALIDSGLIETVKGKFFILKGDIDVFHFDGTVKSFSKRSHNTQLLIDLNQIKQNINSFKDQLRSNTKLMVMVKAFAYGAGSVEVAKFLQQQMVDYLAVAFIDEGIELRQNGITSPIMVMSPAMDDVSLLLKYDLEPELYSLDQIKAYIDALKKEELALEAHLMINTGMNRLGFDKSDIEELIQILRHVQSIEVKSIMTHLAAADDPREEAFTHEQHQSFQDIASKISKALEIKPLLHSLNSSGISNYPEYQMDMVRLGIGMHGVGHLSNDVLKFPTSLQTTITQIRHVQKGATIGYGRLGKAERDLVIATIPLGYADGYLRCFGNGKAYVMVNGQKAKTIGSVCMDITMIDITGIAAKVNDEVIVFGQEPNIETLAACCQTIPYEVLTNISARVKRTFFV